MQQLGRPLLFALVALAPIASSSKNASTRERRAAVAVGIRSAVDVGNDQFADAVLFLTGSCRGVMAVDVWYLCFGVVCEGRHLSEGHHITDRRQNTCQRLILKSARERL